MPKTTELVINTGPLITLVAATGDLQILNQLYQRVLVPFEVSQEIIRGGPQRFAAAEFAQAKWLVKKDQPLEITPFLRNSLDLGEAAVIQLAINEKLSTVCIDEMVGRRMARLNGLLVTGSIGVLLRAKSEGHLKSMAIAIQKMREKGIWLSQRVIRFALKQAQEDPGVE
jgi:predicted nucleic acid-binding protein